jgi:hypothetical protein
MSETWLLLVFEAPCLAPWIRIRIWIRLDIRSWIRIRIETNADPQHWLPFARDDFDLLCWCCVVQQRVLPGRLPHSRHREYRPPLSAHCSRQERLETKHRQAD